MARRILRITHPEEQCLSQSFVLVDASEDFGDLSPEALSLLDSDGSDINLDIVVLDPLPIHGQGRLGRIFKGTLRDSIPVVVKFVIPQGQLGNGRRLYAKPHRTIANVLLQDLHHEASFYAGRLEPLQGSVVPRCYGYGRNAQGSCLVLEDAGKTLEFPYPRLPFQDRHVLYQLQVQLHAAGISHGDVAKRNFTKGPNGIRLIDFDRAKLHDCPGYDPEAETDTDCPELRKIFGWFGVGSVEGFSGRPLPRFEPWTGPPWYQAGVHG